ncbi:SDR family NAD(P)-dependent oxidoreductase [Streptomyces sp. NPDC101455]|uniref:SDR family NAD(P)-dependent oxidoreductase n=1 Tax=Streptomyces sp. NPDC101455 TaxID=3366142 RepID=UPI0038054927
MTSRPVALVTGAAKGIGLAISRRLAADGFAVALSDIDIREAEARAVELPDAVSLEHDVRNPGHARRVVEETLTRYGRIDVLVNNAGTNIHSHPTAEITDEDLDFVLDINLKGTFYSTRAVIPTMQAQKAGRIINMSSVLGLKPAPYVAPYVASKFAVTGLTQSLAAELAKDGITVNSVHPGIVATELHDRVTEGLSRLRGVSLDAATDYFEKEIPLGRYQTVDDVAALVAFLASDAAKDITGSSFKIDGGMGVA